MIIDIIVLILLALAIYRGFTKGLVVALFSFLAFLVGLAAALKLSALVAVYLSETTNISQRWLPVLAFVIVFFVVVLLVRLGAKAIEGVLRIAMLGWLNRLGGIIFFAMLYLMIFSVILFYSSKVNIIKPETSAASVSYSYIQPLGPAMVESLGIVLPFFKNMFAELEGFFSGLSQKAS
jgi:membrane protein required for colicin V production